MPVLPVNFGSTTFSPRVTSYELLAQRIRRQLGEPMIDIEAANEQIYECIDIAAEFYTKFAGTTEEYLIFRSDLYQRGYGLEIGKLMNTSPDMYTTGTPGLSAGWDYDLNAYRKVVEIINFEQGNNSGVNTLFTIENTIAQQAYFGHLLGNMGYDLVTWHALKSWLDTREKMLGMTPFLRFDPERQLLRVIPEPSQSGSPYFGVVGCKMLKPIKDIVSQLWVYKYSMALVKENIGFIRGKYSGTILFGGQTVNYQEIFQAGVKEKDALEAQMVTNSYDSEPPRFFCY
jgi:hypothetical protein